MADDSDEVDPVAVAPAGQLIGRLATLTTAAVSDALDAQGLPGSVHGIAPLTSQRLAGPAFTVAYQAAGCERGNRGGVGLVGSVGDFLDDVPPGGVVVIDNAGRTDCTVWGGIMTQAALVRGLAGTVIHGAARDVAISRAYGYPLFTTGRFMRTGKDRVRLAGVGVALSIAGVPICPGDWVTGDADGVVVIPARHLEQVVDIAEGIERIEHRIVDAVHAGGSLRQARAVHGYHKLQRGAR
ncbi:MAG: diguanylate cyclase [Pseudonocardiales bacterium]|nr:MAG: diguanylate cyclase [Pseudonocardiales bacterium]